MDNPAMPPSRKPGRDDAPLFLQLLRCGRFHRIHGHRMHRSATHDHLLIWVLEGKGFAHSQGQCHDARAGDVLLFDRGPAQTYGADNDAPWSIVWAHFDGPWAGDFHHRLRQTPRLNGRLGGPLGLDATLRSRFNEMIDASRLGVDRQAHLCSCLLAGLLGMMVHALHQPMTPSAANVSPRDMGTLLTHIDRNLHRPMAVADLARQASLSERQLNRLFHQAVGVSPMQHVLQQRMAKAALLLAQTDLPIKQIGSAVGCDDPYYFSRQFRQHTGQSPTTHRQAHRQG